MTAENELEEAYNAVERRAIRFEKSRKEMDQVHTEYDIFDRESARWMRKIRVLRNAFERRALECTCRCQGSY